MQGRGGHVHRDMAPIIWCSRALGRTDARVLKSCQNQNNHKARTPVATAARTLSFPTSAVAMYGERSSGAALRRRERRTRAWQRHVRSAMQLALAEELHHSANKVEQYVARRGQRPRATREEEVHETHDAPRGLRTPLTGMRPAPLSEVAGPQEWVQWRTVEQIVEFVPLVAPVPQMEASILAVREPFSFNVFQKHVARVWVPLMAFPSDVPMTGLHDPTDMIVLELDEEEE